MEDKKFNKSFRNLIKIANDLNDLPDKYMAGEFEEYEIVNVGVLEKVFEPNAEVNKKILIEKNLIKGKYSLKVLGDGELKKYPPQVGK